MKIIFNFGYAIMQSTKTITMKTQIRTTATGLIIHEYLRDGRPHIKVYTPAEYLAFNGPSLLTKLKNFFLL